MNFEGWYTDDILILANVVNTNEGFDHEYGREEISGLEVGEIHVLHYIKGMDYDLTKGYPDWKIEYYKNWVLEKHRERNAA